MTMHLPGDQLWKKNHDAFGSGVGNKCCHSASGNLQQQSCNSGSGIAECLQQSACCTARPRFRNMKKYLGLWGGFNQAAKAAKSQCRQGNCNSVWYNGGFIAAALAMLLKILS